MVYIGIFCFLNYRVKVNGKVLKYCFGGCNVIVDIGIFFLVGLFTEVKFFNVMIGVKLFVVGEVIYLNGVYRIRVILFNLYEMYFVFIINLLKELNFYFFFFN